MANPSEQTASVPGSKPRRWHSRRWVRVLAVLAFIGGLLLVLAPVVVRHAAENWLVERGLHEAHIDDVDLNPFTGELEVHGLVTRLGEHTVLRFENARVEVDWWPLASRQVLVNDLRLRDAEIVVEFHPDGRIQAGGLATGDPSKATPPPAEPEEPWLIGIGQLLIEHTSVDLRSPDLDRRLLIERASLLNLKAWTPDTPGQLTLKGALNDASIELDLELSPFAKQAGVRGRIHTEALELAPFTRMAQAGGVGELAGRLGFDLNLDGAMSSATQARMRLSGQLALDQARVVMPEAELDAGIGSLALSDVDLELALTDAGTTLGVKTAIAAGALEARAGTTQANLAAVNFTGTAGFESAGDASWQLGGDLATEGGGVTLDTGSGMQLSWAGLNAQSLSADASGAAGFARFSARDLRVADGGGRTLAAIGETDITDARRNAAGVVDVAGFGANDVLALPTGGADAPSGLAEAKSLRISAVRFAPETEVNAATVEFTDLVARLVRTAEGGIEGIADSAPGAEAVSADVGAPAVEPETESAAGDATAPPALRIRLDRIAIVGDSRVQFVDHGVEPAFETAILIRELEATGLDTENPGTPGKLHLRAATDRHSEIALDGVFAPLTVPPIVDLAGEIKAVEMPPLSAYASRLIGYRITSGQLSAKISAKIDQGNMDVENTLRIGKLTVEAVPDAPDSLGVPLEAGLAMLRDRDGNIEIDLPVTGRYDAPDFSVDDIVRQALGKALKGAALATLTVALQPYGAILAIAKIAGQAGTTAELQAIGFDPGAGEVGAANADYLDKLAALMNDRPGLGLKLCGVATDADRAALNAARAAAAAAKAQAAAQTAPKPAGAAAVSAPPAPVPGVTDAELLTLAHQRGDALKGLLIERHKIGADRLFLCEPELDSAADAKGRVDLRL
ncbi:MAG: DUF748 domain-containing protein [Chromatiales bacterium]|nr:DUF748 domain-containing protein [Chromatiales bacterium]